MDSTWTIQVVDKSSPGGVAIYGVPEHHQHHELHIYTLVDGTSMNEECIAVDAVQPQVDRQVCAVRFLT